MLYANINIFPSSCLNTLGNAYLEIAVSANASVANLSLLANSFADSGLTLTSMDLSDPEDNLWQVELIVDNVSFDMVSNISGTTDSRLNLNLTKNFFLISDSMAPISIDLPFDFYFKTNLNDYGFTRTLTYKHGFPPILYFAADEFTRNRMEFFGLSCNLKYLYLGMNNQQQFVMHFEAISLSNQVSSKFLDVKTVDTVYEIRMNPFSVSEISMVTGTKIAGILPGNFYVYKAGDYYFPTRPTNRSVGFSSNTQVTSDLVYRVSVPEGVFQNNMGNVNTPGVGVSVPICPTHYLPRFFINGQLVDIEANVIQGSRANIEMRDAPPNARATLSRISQQADFFGVGYPANLLMNSEVIFDNLGQNKFSTGTLFVSGSANYSVFFDSSLGYVIPETVFFPNILVPENQRTITMNVLAEANALIPVCESLSNITVVASEIGGPIYGSGPYAVSSDLARTVIHAGLADSGELVSVARINRGYFRFLNGSLGFNGLESQSLADTCAFDIQVLTKFTPVVVITTTTTTTTTTQAPPVYAPGVLNFGFVTSGVINNLPSMTKGFKFSNIDDIIRVIVTGRVGAKNTYPVPKYDDLPSLSQETLWDSAWYDATDGLTYQYKLIANVIFSFTTIPRAHLFYESDRAWAMYRITVTQTVYTNNYYFESCCENRDHTGSLFAVSKLLENYQTEWHSNSVSIPGDFTQSVGFPMADQT